MSDQLVAGLVALQLYLYLVDNLEGVDDQKIVFNIALNGIIYAIITLHFVRKVTV